MEVKGMSNKLFRNWSDVPITVSFPCKTVRTNLLSVFAEKDENN